MTISSTDTIVAPATAAGRAAIAVMRLSGSRAIEIADSIWQGKSLLQAVSHTAHLGTLLDTRCEPLDQAVAIVYRAPNSYTGEDSVEFSVHGSAYVRRELLDTLMAAGARLADPGEFTRRAFLNGRIDLIQAEAVADIIASESRAAQHTAMSQLQGKLTGRIQHLRQQLIDMASLLELELDFSEEDVEFASRSRLANLAAEIRTEIQRLLNGFSAGDAIMHGIPVAIAGAPNAGKSSLLNALLGHERAIVSDIPGTTRDTIEEILHIGDHHFRLIDTAGLHDTADPIERIGIDRTHVAMSSARIILYVHDATLPFDWAEIPVVSHAFTILILNKTDLIKGSAERITSLSYAVEKNAESNVFDAVIPLSAVTGQGLDKLLTTISATASDLGADVGDILVANARHAVALRDAFASIDRVIAGLTTSLPPDLVAQPLRETIAHLSALTGAIPSTLLLSTIFSRFCIGK